MFRDHHSKIYGIYFMDFVFRKCKGQCEYPYDTTINFHILLMHVCKFNERLLRKDFIYNLDYGPSCKIRFSVESLVSYFYLRYILKNFYLKGKFTE